jgi:hypothetical protein
LLRQAVERRNQQLWSEPADYALANPRIAQLHDALGQADAQPKLPAALTAALQASGAPAPAAALSDEDRHAATAAYANATLAEQERLGLPADRRQVLPAAQAQELVARILDGDIKAAADTLRDLIATWGDAAPMALADLSRHGLPGEYRLLASFTDPATRQTFAKVLTAQATDPGALRGKAGDEAETIDGLVSDAVQSIGGLANDPPKLSSRVSIAANGQGFSMQAAPARRGVIKRAPTVSEFPSPRTEPLYDDDGDPVMVWSPDDGADVQVMIPEGVSLKFFAEMGETDRNLPWPEQMVRLSKFLWGQVWDLQRPITKLTDGLPSEQKFRGEFRDVATIAIGVYAAAADIPLETILNYQKIAAYRSRFAPTEIINDDYGPLAERNVRNTELGYNLYKFGKIKAK